MTTGNSAALNAGRLASLTTTAGQVKAAIDAGKDIINSVTELHSAVMKLYGAFEGAKAFGDRHRTLELIIVNATSHRLVWEGSFFDSGTTFAGPAPMNIDPIDELHPIGATLWTVANGQGSIMTGVSGAGKWRIEGTRFALDIGFTNPQFGGFKSEIGVVGAGAPVRLAYDACDNVEAKQYEVLGFNVAVYADQAAAGGDRRFVYCITEARQDAQANRGDTLKAGEYLTPGQFLISRNGAFAASYQEKDGNLVVSDLNSLHKSVWASSTSFHNAWRCGLDAQGKFSTLEGEGQAVWSASASAPGSYVTLSDEGVLSVYDEANNPVWSSR